MAFFLIGILQQEFLELEYVVEVLAAGRHTGGIDFLPDVVHKLVPTPPQAFNPHRSPAERAVVVPPATHDVEVLQRETRGIDLLMTAGTGCIRPMLLQ